MYGAARSFSGEVDSQIIAIIICCLRSSSEWILNLLAATTIKTEFDLRTRAHASTKYTCATTHVKVAHYGPCSTQYCHIERRDHFEPFIGSPQSIFYKQNHKVNRQRMLSFHLCDPHINFADAYTHTSSPSETGATRCNPHGSAFAHFRCSHIKCLVCLHFRCPVGVDRSRSWYAQTHTQTNEWIASPKDQHAILWGEPQRRQEATAAEETSAVGAATHVAIRKPWFAIHFFLFAYPPLPSPLFASPFSARFALTHWLASMQCAKALRPATERAVCVYGSLASMPCEG